jgi:hypothetical protein
MNSNMIVYLTMMFLIVSLSDAKTLYIDNHFEMTGENASSFLHTTYDGDHHTSDFSKREMGRNCIPCKFGINPCCEPNICVKKTLWPDECMEIKRAGPSRHN